MRIPGWARRETDQGKDEGFFFLELVKKFHGGNGPRRASLWNSGVSRNPEGIPLLPLREFAASTPLLEDGNGRRSPFFFLFSFLSLPFFLFFPFFFLLLTTTFDLFNKKIFLSLHTFELFRNNYTDR